MKKLFFAVLLSLTGIAAYAQTSVLVTNSIPTGSGGTCPHVVQVQFYVQTSCGPITAAPMVIPCPPGITTVTNTMLGFSPTTQIVGCTVNSTIGGPHSTASLGDAATCGITVSWGAYGPCCGMYNYPGTVTCQEEAMWQSAGATAYLSVN
ncbi:MAG: hypothetical protein P4L41_07770 [Flavipsychrobacter sp.]|nr:hypothetical protein [Flavipsychrobacter sp.]